MKEITEKVIEAAAMTWAEATWMYSYGHMEDDDQVDTTEIWLKAQMDANNKLKAMTIDDEEDYIYHYQEMLDETGSVLPPDLKYDSDIYNAALVAWSEVKWHIQHDASLAYPEDAVQYEWLAQESLHNYIDQAGGEEKYYKQHISEK